MAFSSISNRLWLTYLVIVVLVLLIGFAGIIVAFQRSPVLYHEVFYRISLVNGFLTERLSTVSQSDWGPFITMFLNEVKVSDIKIAVINSQGDPVHLTDQTAVTDLPNIGDPQSFALRSRERILTFRDDNKKYWFYQISQINADNYLITAAQRPNVSILVLFQDELLRPLFTAGVIALIIAFIIGWFISRWITRPLENISAAAEQIAEGNYVTVPIEGPSEVKQLASTINDMVVKVQDSLQSQQDFVANVSHEFKTPLTSIQGFAQAIYDEAITTKKDRKNAANIILGETERLNHLVNDLLVLARFDAGTMNLDKTRVDINQLVGNTLERFKFQIASKKLKVDEQLPGKISLVIDGEKISQVLNNLIDNAIKFSPAGSQIGAATRHVDGWVSIDISDSGPGISKEDQKRIFERFFQVDKSRKGGPGRGVGLGLAIARQIVQAHGGDIKVTSRPGEGSTFMVKLPSKNAQRNHRTG